ncbi:MAG: hypothetical protein AAB495_02225 [Patescibacteria group bacterium]
MPKIISSLRSIKLVRSAAIKKEFFITASLPISGIDSVSTEKTT